MIPIVYLSFAFAISELILMLVKRSKTGSSKTQNDKGSLWILWVIITIGFSAGFILGRPIYNFYAVAGFCFIVSGLIIRWLAILQLGKSFTVDVAIIDIAQLKTDGIYKRIRHPSYTGLIAVITGFALTMNSVYSFIVFVVPVFSAIIYRIGVEEKVLITEFGNRYLEYKSRTKRIIPGVY